MAALGDTTMARSASTALPATKKAGVFTSRGSGPTEKKVGRFRRKRRQQPPLRPLRPYVLYCRTPNKRLGFGISDQFLSRLIPQS
jgi:hypothetical protein